VGGILTQINKIRFVSKKDFDKHQTECPPVICKKIDIVKKTLNGLQATVETNAKESQERREADKKELNIELKNISRFIGSVEQFMKKNHKE